MPGLCPGHLNDSASYAAPRSETLPCLTRPSAFLIVACVMALSEPTSSFLPHGPQPLPLVQPLTPGSPSPPVASSARAAGSPRDATKHPSRNAVPSPSTPADHFTYRM